MTSPTTTATTTTEGENTTGKISWRVVVPAAIIAALLILPALIVPAKMSSIVSTISATVISDLGWYYVLAVVAFVAFALFLAISRFGDIVLGSDDSEPEYSRVSWFAMLFAAGMGIGLVFYGVAEPLSHYTSPVPSSRATTDAQLAQEAVTTTFLHWGLSAWAIYVVVGIAIAYMCHRRGRPASMRWVLEPLLGTKRVQGPIGDLVDIIAIVGTLFGVATSLGFGATQFASGLDFLGLIKQNEWVLLAIIVIVSSLAALSVASGLDKGIKLLSNSNLVLAGLLMVFILLAGQPLFVLREFVQSIGNYIQQFIPMSFRTMPYQGEAGEEWLGSWTTYYWGWWMSWSPFVGIFIARISRGRTVREFVVGVLAVPTLMTFLWFTIMGGNAIWQQMHGHDLTANEGWTTTALFSMLDNLPGGTITTGLFLILLVVFFVTSSDSASFVLGMMSTNGSTNPPLSIRLGWAVAQTIVAAVVLVTGTIHGSPTDGLTALQVLSVLTSVPFSIVLLASCASMYKAFNGEHHRRVVAERKMLRERLETLVEEKIDETTASRRRRFVPDEPLYTSPRPKRGPGEKPARRPKGEKMQLPQVPGLGSARTGFERRRT